MKITSGPISEEHDPAEANSDVNPTVIYEYIPVKYDLLFIGKQLDDKGIKIDVNK